MIQFPNGYRKLRNGKHKYYLNLEKQEKSHHLPILLEKENKCSVREVQDVLKVHE